MSEEIKETTEALLEIENEKPIPDAEMPKRELPLIGIPENTVKIGPHMIEIKSTMFQYMRNRVSAFYKILDVNPLPEILAWKPGIMGGDDKRDGDKCVMDWLIAVIDNEDRPEGEAAKIIQENYNTITAHTVETMLEIFKRVNHITEKEEKLKKIVAERGGMN